MSNGRICLLPSIDAAADFLAGGGLEQGWLPVSTHWSVVDHFEGVGKTCRDVSEYVSLEDQRWISEALIPGGPLADEAHTLLAAMDACAPQNYHVELGIRHHIPLFPSAFEYLAHCAIWGRESFRRALGRLAEDCRATEFRVYASAPEVPNYAPEDLVAMFCAESGSLRFEVVRASGDVALRPFVTRPGRRTFRSVAESMRHRVGVLARRLGLEHTPLPGPGALLMLQPEGQFLPWLSMTPRANVLKWPEAGLPCAEALGGLDLEGLRLRADRVAARIQDALSRPAPVLGPEGYQRRLAEFFSREGSRLLLSLAIVDALLASGRVGSLAWGYGAGADPLRSLLSSYALRAGARVAGIQHGPNMLIQGVSCFPVLSELSKCSDYFSWWFSGSEARAHLMSTGECRINPVGNQRLTSCTQESLERRMHPARVVFPLTNCFGLLESARQSPALLAASQRRIIEALEARTDLDAWLKPFAGASPSTYAWGGLTGRLRHVKVSSEQYSRFLQRHRPGLMICEFPSSPLFESLAYDMELFLLLDPVFEFCAEAETFLRRRVHVFGTIDELLEAIGAYGRAGFPRLRNNDFVERYMFRRDAVRRLASEMDLFMRGAAPQ